MEGMKALKRIVLLGLIAVAVAGLRAKLHQSERPPAQLLREVTAAHQAVLEAPASASEAHVEAAAEALRHVTEVVPGTREAATALELIGRMHFARGEYARARKIFQEIIWNYHAFRDPALSALLYVGRTHEQEGNWKAAVKAYQEIADHHQWSDIWLQAPLYAADVYERRKDAPGATEAYARAIRAYRQRLVSAPTAGAEVKARGYLALAYKRTGDRQQMLEALNALSTMREQAQDAEMLLIFARVYAMLEFSEPARVCYQELLQRFPRDPLADAARVELAKFKP